MLLGTFTSCANGAKVTACVVDVKNNGFQCVNYQQVKSFVPFEKGEYLECTSPQELEDALKACKDHKVLPVTLCTLEYSRQDFLCVPPKGNNYYLKLDLADNYFCMSDQDRKRVLERCAL